MKKHGANAYVLTFVGVMAAIIYVVTLFRFPLLGSKVHFANAVCLLSGMLLGPWWGGAAAGLGSALYDAFGGGYDLINVLIIKIITHHHYQDESDHIRLFRLHPVQQP